MNKHFGLIISILIIFLLISCKNYKKNIVINKKYKINKNYKYNNENSIRFRGDNGNSISNEKGWNANAITNLSRINWQINIGDGYSAVSIKDGCIYTLGSDRKNTTETIYCIDFKTGKIIWNFSFPSKKTQYYGPKATPFIDNDYVYTIGSAGNVFCLEAVTGKLIWQKHLVNDFNGLPTEYGYTGSPVIEGNILLINSHKYGIALNKKNGDLIWKSDNEICGYATPVILNYNNKKYAAVFGAKALYITDYTNGKLFASYNWKTAFDTNASDPVAFDNKILISSGYNTGCALLELTGTGLKEIWINKEIGSQFSSCILVDGKIYGVHGNTGIPGIISKDGLKCIDFNTGKLLWKIDEGYGSIIYADKKIIYLNDKGKLLIIEVNESGYKEIARSEMKKAHYWIAPILCRGRLFIRSNRGDVFCMDVR